MRSQLLWWGADRPSAVGPAPADVRSRLGELSIFAGASDADLEHLAGDAEEVRYQGGRRVIREGRIPSHLYLVSSGELEVWTSGDHGGEQQRVNTLGPDDHFGEVGLLEGMPSTATVSTVGEVRLIRVPATAFLEVLARSPEVTRALVESAGGALARSHPTYRLAAEVAPGPRTPEQLIKESRDLLDTLDGEPRREFAAKLKQIATASEDES